MASDDEKKSIDDNRFRELSPGNLLVWARERAGLSQEEVAKDLYMTLTKVRALESDDYRHMSSDTFTRGYLRSYASFVKLDVAQVLAAYDRHAQTHGLVEEKLPRRVESAHKPLWQFAALVLAALLMLWLISIWFFDNRQQSSYDRSAPVLSSMDAALDIQITNQSSVGQASVSSAAVTSVPVLDGMQSNTVLDTSITVMQGASSSGAAQSSATSSSPSSLMPSPQQQTTSNLLDKIDLAFTEECWLEVSDARGDVLVADLQPPGSRLQLQGRAPFDVILGNSSAAKIELNGINVSIVPALGTKVLSIKVGESTRE